MSHKTFHFQTWFTYQRLLKVKLYLKSKMWLIICRFFNDCKNAEKQCHFVTHHSQRRLLELTEQFPENPCPNLRKRRSRDCKGVRQRSRERIFRHPVKKMKTYISNR